MQITLKGSHILALLLTASLTMNVISISRLKLVREVLKETQAGLMDNTVQQLTEDNWDTFILAVAWQESKWDTKAVGTKDDVGYLQITPVIVADANRILGYEKYTLEDRTSKTKSIEMYNVIMSNYNPQHDMNFAMKIWNPKAPVSYHRNIMAKYNELLKSSI